MLRSSVSVSHSFGLSGNSWSEGWKIRPRLFGYFCGNDKSRTRAFSFSLLSFKQVCANEKVNIFYAHPEHNENTTIHRFGVFLHFLTLPVYTHS